MTGQGRALVTGGARRIGAAICGALHASGYNIALHYHQSTAEAEALAIDLNKARPDSCLLYNADLGNAEGPRQLTSSVLADGPVSVLVNNAALYYPTPLEHPFDEAWPALINTNLQAPLLMSHALYGSLKAESGCIINLLDAHTAHPQRGYALYDLSKNGLASLTRSLALEMAPEVRVNGVAPGAILLPAGEQLLSGAASAAEFTQKIPLQRLGQETDIAAAVTFLVTAAPYITGQVLAVDGGRNLLG